MKSNKIITATYDYKDESGELLYQVVRFEPKSFAQRRPDGNGDWVWSLDGVRRILYRLPELLQANSGDWIFVVEGEKDADRLYDEGLVATTCPMGVGKWDDNYSEFLNDRSKVTIIPDNDNAGRKHAKQIAESLLGVGVKPRIVELVEVPEKGDVSDWLNNGGTKEKLIELAENTKIYELIDTSQFKPLSSQKLLEILGLTIKKDEQNKLITFLCELSAYTESSQFNISFNAPSSTGKSYIPTEIAQLFPPEDVIEIGYCSPTAFFHDVGKYSEKHGGYVVDLSRKILIFLDQPHTLLLQHLRPILSHDKKQIRMKITDKSQKHGLKTKNILLRGYPAVIFCTAGLKIDEQEATRFLLLSPETNQEKIREAIYEKLRKETDTGAYQKALDSHPERNLLKQRIRAIKQESIKEIRIGSPQRIEERFFRKNKVLKPRHQRDIGRLVSLIKSFALLNLWFRDKDGSSVVANEADIEAAFKIWDVICESQELNLPPYIYQLYREVILPAWNDKNKDRAEGFEEITGGLGLTRQDIIQKHYEVYRRFIPDWQLRQQIIPMLETVGLITQERDPNDRRKMLIYPTTPLTISDFANQGNTEQNADNGSETIVSWMVG
ncbi:MAG: toprim domain-containing protein [Planctomycetota bacterium]|jgi:5S rRNA maturation endonuclease (ribonuclease M5)